MQKINESGAAVRDCRNCDFHETTTKADKQIVTLCRKRFEIAHVAIPQGTGVGFVAATLWAEMRPGDWCGDFVDAGAAAKARGPALSLVDTGPR